MVTTASYIDRVTELHKGLYSYESLIYKGCQSPIEITCKDHGNFWQDANSHQNGRGCPKCWSSRRKFAKRSSSESFFNKCSEVHNSKYNYVDVVYDGHSSKLKLLCPAHGVFETLASNHISGKGCKHCAVNENALRNTSNTTEFISKCLVVHGDRYNYSLVDYVKNHIKVDIACKEHGVFKQSPANHLLGKGCSACQTYGYSVAKPGSLYILTNESLTKVGITNRAVATRAGDIKRKSGYDFKVVDSFTFEDGRKALNIETTTLQYLASKYSRIQETFDGSTECFQDVCLTDLLSFITPLATASVTQ